MISLSALGAAALLKLGSLKAAMGRFFNGSGAIAIVASVAVVAALIGGAWVWRRIEAGAVAGWQSRLMTSRYVAALRERKLQREADQRVTAEREVLVEQIHAQAAYAVELERTISRMASNPICYPADLTKELRK